MLFKQALPFLVGFAGHLPIILAAADPGQTYLAPLAGMEDDEDFPRFPDEYIIELRPGYSIDQHFETIGMNLSNSMRFHRLGFGYIACMNDEIRDEQVRRDHGVLLVEANKPVYLIEPVDSTEVVVSNNSSSANPLSKRYSLFHSLDAPYGLQMLTTGKKRLKTPVQNGGTYDCLYGAGQGVQVYVMDTGIRLTHELFQGRARNFGGLKSTDKSPYVDEPMQDTHGHGTHVAGTIGAEKYGVAPSASLINVKVLGQGSNVGRIADAIRAITDEHISNKKKSGNGFWKFRGSVINMSLTCSFNSILLTRLINANDAGISVFVAAGNDNVDARKTYPCALPEAKCVAAVDNSYRKAWFSNYGGNVDYIAPGEGILSLGISSDTAIVKMSGTSMASPHVAGAAAIFASWKGLVNKFDLSQNFVYWNSIPNVVSGFKSTTKLFVTTGIHSAKKYRKEPFRWAGDYPVGNHLVLNSSMLSTVTNPAVQTPVSLPLSDLATSLYTATSTITLPPITGLHTLTGDVTYDPTVPATSSSSATTTSAGTPCVGNQIEGSCVQAQPPTATPDSGVQSPICDKAGDGTYVMFNATQASKGVSTYCSELISDKVVLSNSSDPPKAGFVTDAAANNGHVAITVIFDVDSCNPGTSTANQKLDFSTWTQDKCYQYLYANIADRCTKDSSWPDYNPEYSLEGGFYGESCALWSLAGLPGSAPSR